MEQELVASALQMAAAHRQPGEGVLHHMDRGSQYASHAYKQLLDTHGMQVSMSRKGDCYDNAVMESFFSPLKSECPPTSTPHALKRAALSSSMWRCGTIARGGTHLSATAAQAPLRRDIPNPIPCQLNRCKSTLYRFTNK
jgi:transposase InsO family protein